MPKETTETFRRAHLILTLAALLIITNGCHRSSNQSSTSSEAESGVTFNPKHGLSIPARTAEFIGLQVADLTERKLAATFQFSALVYRTTAETPTTAPSAMAHGTVSPTEAAHLSEGQNVSVQGHDGVARPGRVVTINRELAQATGQVEVLLALFDHERPLHIGTSIAITVPLGGETNVVSVPRSALFRTTEGDFVYTVSGAHFVRTPVKLGVTNHEFAEIADGLYPGDQIVVQPAMTLWLAELQTLRGGKSCADGH